MPAGKAVRQQMAQGGKKKKKRRVEVKQKPGPESVSEDDTMACVKWAMENGLSMDGVRYKISNTGGGGGLVATEDLKPGRVVLRIPGALVLSSDLAMASKIGVAISSEFTVVDMATLEGIDKDRAVLPRSVSLAYLIALQRGGSAGGFDAGGNPLAQYVQSLPKAISTPAVWSDADMLNQVDELKDDVAEVRFKANLGG